MVEPNLALAVAPVRRQLTPSQAGRLKRTFLEHYAHFGNITHSANLTGISRGLVSHWRELDPEFADAMLRAGDQAVEVLEHEAWKRGVQGNPYERTTYWKGEPVGTDRKIEYSDNLLLALLRARAPERYRDKVDVHANVIVKAIAGIVPTDVL